MRDRLIELLKQINFDYSEECVCASEDGYKGAPDFAKFFADHLLAEGVIVPPCYIGQEIWYIRNHYDGRIEIIKGKVSMLQQKSDKSWKIRITVNSSVWDFTSNEIGTEYFLTREEAEKALLERSENGKS